MKVLIVGNMGYVGSRVVRELAERHPDATLHGYDNAYFAHCLTGVHRIPEAYLERQYFDDIRTMPEHFLDGYTAVVQLAAVSNDPMGERFAAETTAINQEATLRLAHLASRAGVSHFVFASSCSIYGIADGPPRREDDELVPLTDYACSKVRAEQGLAQIGGDMVVTSLRFATACGMSDRLRLDLVLNDFVASAIAQRRITVLSDGTPWRPLIDVADMGRAVDWALSRPPENGGRILSVNVGSNERNHQVRELAYAVADHLPGTEVCINRSMAVDSRSYRVDFSLYTRLAPDYLPRLSLSESIDGLIEGLRRMRFEDRYFRASSLIRLNILQQHIDEGRVAKDLTWIIRRGSTPRAEGGSPSL